VNAHRTVLDPRDTIGRWRQESDDSFTLLSEEVFGDTLTQFGYG
jgi:hypothetical protein